jgi:predicted lipoprotein with Yx(FWY)xxD motif
MRSNLTAGASLVAAVLFLAACGSGGSDGGDSGQAGRPDTVTTARNAQLAQTVLVDHAGKTLYALSAEKNGRFICTDKTCLSLWQPLTVAGAGTPQGTVASLGTIKRPDGAFQVTYKSKPLYTFAQDAAPGDSKGEGFRDVGVWHAVTTSGAASSQPKPAGGGGYGGYG